MPDEERLEKFVVNEAETLFSYRGDVENTIGDDPEFETSDFLDYLRGTGEGYEISTTVEPEGGNHYLQLHCVGTGWHPQQKSFNEQLQYIASPLHDGEITRDKEVLMLKKSIVDANLKLGTTNWVLANSRVQKSQYNDRSVNDVIMYWKHKIWNDYEAGGQKPNKDKYVVTCWKWAE